LAATSVTIDFWDVGQADCSVVELPNKSLVIIDVGSKASPVVDYLQGSSFRIAAIVLTHTHEDHAGAMPSIVHSFKKRIGTVFMLTDVDKRQKSFQRIFRPVAEAFRAGFFAVEQLQNGAEIARDDAAGLTITCVYPDYVQGVDAKNRNDHSGIICLSIAGEKKVIWPGDVRLQHVFDNAGGGNPIVMVGPHHGAPADWKDAYLPAWIGNINPVKVFVSVGTDNIHSHPRPAYIHRLRDHGCQIACSQITNHCDRRAVAVGRPILPSHGILGLPVPKKGVACRGALRLEFQDGKLLTDRLDAEHRRRISTLHRPLCLQRSDLRHPTTRP
jgi:competence protein ComEC